MGFEVRISREIEFLLLGRLAGVLGGGALRLGGALQGGFDRGSLGAGLFGFKEFAGP